MPSQSQPSRTTPRWLTATLLLFSAASAILWLLPLTSNHSILSPAGPAFEDIIVYKGRFTLYHTAKFFTSRAFSGFAYPAGAAPIYEAFPLIFLIQRANIEIVLWLIIALGLIAYRRGLAILAAILFGIAAAVKLYPILLLGLFLKRKKDIPAFLIGLLTAAAAMYAAVAYTGPTVAIAANGFFRGVDRFQDHYVDTVSKVEVAFDHSLFSPIKYFTYTNHTSPAPWTTLYYVTAGAFALLLFLRVRTLPFLNRVVFLVAAMVSLPPVSFTYTLVHLYVPTLLLLAALATFRTRPPATAIAALMLLLFLMLPIMSLSILTPLPTGPIQSCALFILLILTVLTPWPEASIADA